MIDGVTLREEPKEAVKRSGIPLLIGNAAQEANLFLHAIPTAALPFASRFLRLNVPKGSGRYRERLSDALTEHIYIRPQIEILRGYAGPAWRYVYRYAFPRSTMGCFHTCELAVMMGVSSDRLGHVDDPESERVGAELCRIWRQFARDGHLDWEPGVTGQDIL